MVNRLRRLRAIRASRSRGIVSSLRLNYPELAEGPANFHEPSRDLALSDCLRHCLDEDMYECSVEKVSWGVILYDFGCRRGEKGGQRQTTFFGRRLASAKRLAVRNDRGVQHSGRETATAPYVMTPLCIKRQ